MNIEKTFNQIIEKLKSNQRPLLKLTQEDYLELSQKFAQARSEKNETLLQQVLCILDHTQNQSHLFDQDLYFLLKETQNPQLQVFALSAIQTHIILRQQKAGERLPMDLFEALKPLLKSRELEVIEWTLRTIEQTGRQSVILKQDVLLAKPGLKALFNKNAKNIKDIVELLEQRWS